MRCPPYDDKPGGFILSECQPSLPSSPTSLFSSVIIPSLTLRPPPPPSFSRSHESRQRRAETQPTVIRTSKVMQAPQTPLC